MKGDKVKGKAECKGKGNKKDVGNRGEGRGNVNSEGKVWGRVRGKSRNAGEGKYKNG